MQQYNDFNRPSPEKTIERRSGIRRFLGVSCLVPILGFGLIMGACAVAGVVFFATASVVALRPAATRTPLPALTPTSLPTLTPTVSPVEVAGVPSSSSSVFSPSNAEPSNGSSEAQPQSSTGSGSTSHPPQPGRTGAAASSAYSPSNAAPANGNVVAPYNPSTGANHTTENSSYNSSPVASPTPPASTPGSRVVILPTPGAPASTPTPAPTNTPLPLAPTATPRPTESATENDSDDDDDSESEEENINWSFSGVRANTSQVQNGMLVYGNLINHSATAQKIELVNATFFDAQGNEIGEENYIQAHWPSYVVPPHDASMPFQLLVNGLNGAADFNLSLAASSSSNTPREDFEFSDLKQSIQFNSYCVDGHLRNAGGQLQDYLVITVVLYDKKNNVINFQDEQIYNPAGVMGDQTYHFKTCVAPPHNDVARYDLQAWGY